MKNLRVAGAFVLTLGLNLLSLHLLLTIFP